MKRTYLFVLVATLLLSGCTQNNNGNTPVDSGDQSEQSSSTSIDDGYRTVTFDTKGGNHIDSQRILLGEKITKPDNPIKEGNSFVTWTYELEPWDFDEGVVESDMVLEAQYTPNQYELLLAHYNNEEHGIITGNGTYTWGESVILNAVPDTGYIFAGWYKNEYKLLSTEPTYVYTMGVNQTLYARWGSRLNNLSVTSENEEQGTVSIISGSGYSNESVTIKATPADGYSFVGWYNDTLEVSTEDIYTFTMPINDYSLVAKFVSNEVLLQRELGIIPMVSNDRKSFTYGIYPQTVVSDQQLIAMLDSIEEVDPSGWYKYNGRYYHKANAKHAAKMSNGATSAVGNRYWFVCERVTWDIISENNGSFHVLSRAMLPGKYKSADTIKGYAYNFFFSLNNDYITDSSGLSVLSDSAIGALSLDARKCAATDYNKVVDGNYSLYWTSTTGSSSLYYCYKFDGTKQASPVSNSDIELFRFAATFTIA